MNIGTRVLCRGSLGTITGDGDDVERGGYWIIRLDSGGTVTEACGSRYLAELSREAVIEAVLHSVAARELSVARALELIDLVAGDRGISRHRNPRGRA